MLAQARERYPEIEFREGDAEDLPLKDASFEAVVCNFGMNHIPRAERAVAGGAHKLPTRVLGRTGVEVTVLAQG